MKKPYSCIETTLDYETRGCVVRIWFNEKNLVMPEYPQISGQIERIFDKYQHGYSEYDLKGIISEIASMTNVNAVQIKKQPDEKDYRKTSWGTVIYTVDFDKDPHG